VYALRGFFEEAKDAPQVLTPRYLCDVPAEEGCNPEGLSAYGNDADEFIVVVDGERSADGVQARAYVIRVPEPLEG
jgi:hypothetical protein